MDKAQEKMGNIIYEILKTEGIKENRAFITDIVSEALYKLGYRKPPNQLFEPTPEITYTLNCDKCREAFYSSEAFPSPQLCPECSKPDESRLLTIDEARFYCKTTKMRYALGWTNTYGWDALGLLKAQDKETASILKAREQARVERIFREIEKEFGYFTEDGLAKIIIDDYGYYGQEGSVAKWQALKKQELE